MGPHFLQADERVARRRLPQGYRAVLDDADRPRQRYGVLFRRASAADREVIRHKPISEFGAEELLGQAELFGIGEGYYYVLDSEGLSHAWHQHGDPDAEARLGQVPLDVADLDRLDDAVRPRHVVEFSARNGVPPRMVCHQLGPEGTLAVVLEVQHARQWVVIRTMYKWR